MLVKVSVSGRDVSVSPDGPDPQALARAQQAVGLQDPATSNGRLYGYGIGSAVCLLGALGLAISGASAVFAVLGLLAGVVLGALAARVLVARQRAQRDLAAQRDREVQRISEAVQRARETAASQQQAVQESARQLDHIRAALAGSAAAG